MCGLSARLIMRKPTTTVQIFLFLIPFALGVWGFSKEYGSFSPGAIYSAIRLYSFNMDLGPNKSNPVLWIAFFLAIMVTTNLIFINTTRLRSRFNLWRITRQADKCINVLGDEEYIRLFRQSNLTSKKTIISSEEIQAFNAKDIVIFGKNNVETLKLFEKNKLKIQKTSNVHLNLEQTSSWHHLSIANLHLFGIYDNISKLFWREHSLLSPQKVIFIGFGGLGQALLTHALQNNVASLNNELVYHEYHVIGEASKYLQLHTELHNFVSMNESQPNKDSLFIHQTLWDDLELLKNADRIIFCDDSLVQNTIHLQTFRDHVNYEAQKGELFAYLEINNPIMDIHHKLNITPIHSMKDLFSIDAVIMDELQLLAKCIHEQYNKSVEEENQAKGIRIENTLWSDLDSFTIQSNEAQAEHIYVKLKMLKLVISPNSESTISAEDFKKQIELYDLERLAEVEHIRWCRFHWINNWRYSLEIEGNKNIQRRLHKCLIPYAQLNREMKEYDREAIRSIHRTVVAVSKQNIVSA